MKTAKPKPAKSRLALREPAKPLQIPETASLRPDHPMAELMAQAIQGRMSPSDSPSFNDSPPPQEYPLSDSPPPPPSIAHRPDSPPSNDRPSPDDSLTLDFWAAIPHVAGFTKFPHRVVDGLYSQLDLVEQALYTQLFRLSHGYGKDLCTIGLPTLARRANVGRTAAAAAIKRLEGKGLIVKERMIFGKNVEQGISYRLPFPDSPPRKDRPSPDDTNKEEGMKKKDQRVSASPNFQNCPDCSGTGWHPKDGIAGNPVERCKHERLAPG
jgi:hypothetical protein